MFDWGWVKRRWWDFRNGHSTYLAFALSFITFVVVNYNLLSVIPRLFPNILTFAVVFALVYIPLAVGVGYKFHRKQQLPTDQEIATLANPFLFKVTPGKELVIGLPAQRLALINNRKLWKKFGVLTEEDEQTLLRLQEKVEMLMRGEVL